MIESIISSLKETAQSDVFCTKLTASYEELALEVDPLGPLSFPISARTAKSLIVEAEPAKYGKGTQTLLDRRVRDVWEIPQDRIKTGEDWNQKLGSILKKVQKNLALPEDGKLTAELHNMVIYMPGQFFQGHQDSEKVDGMVATLVVLLPSEFTGGNLVIDQHGDKKIFHAPPDITEKLTLIAFYADCHHEVEKVLQGYRVALTYNLIFQPSAEVIPPLQNQKLEHEVKAYFEKKDKTPGVGHPRWLVYLLDHEYTQKSLSWQGLRGADRNRAAQFLACADSLGLQVHLVLADIHETWSAEEDGSWDDYGWDGDEDEEDVEGEPSEYTLTELIDDTIELRHWIDRDGHSLRRKEHDVPKEMTCWTKAVDEFKPFESSYEGYMGNWGNTLDRWYHRAALVLWKKDVQFLNLFVSDSDEALKKISKLLKKHLAKGQAAMQQILPQWPGGGTLDAQLVFEVAALVQSEELASQLVGSLGLRSLSSRSALGFLNLMELYGEKWCLNQLEKWGKQRERYSEEPWTKDLVALVKDFRQKSENISSWILAYQLLQLQGDDKTSVGSSPSMLKHGLKSRISRAEDLLDAARVAEAAEIHRRMIQHVLKYPRLYPAIELIEILKKLDFSHETVWQEFLTQLNHRLVKESSPRVKDDWSIQEEVLHSCEDCDLLREFLESPTEQSFVWPLSKERRRHIHTIIDGLDIPVTHETRRVGSPYQLILTKTSDLFTRDEAHAKAARKGLSVICSIRERIESKKD